MLDLDIQPTHLTRPSKGKSALAEDAAVRVALTTHRPVAVVFLEMSASQFAARCATELTGIIRHQTAPARAADAPISPASQEQTMT